MSLILTGDPTVTAPGRPLWRNWRFQLLWLGSSASSMGTGISAFAYPLMILVITGSPAMAALFGSIQIVCTVAAGVPAGMLIDRWDRRRTLMATEATRAALTASLFLAWSVGHLTIVHLLAAGAVLGALNPLLAARMLVVRAIVPSTQLTQALTQDEVRTALTGLAAPPVGGLLLAASRGLPMLSGALAYAVSFVTAWAVRPPSTAQAGPSEAGAVRYRLFDGVAELWRNRMVRGALVTISIVNVGGVALYLAVVVLLTRHGATPQSIGIAVAGEAVGSLLGAGIVGRLHQQMRPGTLLLAVTAILTVAVALLAIPLGPWWVFGVLAVAMLGVPAVRVLIDVLILRHIPDDRRGRTMTAVMTIMTIGAPVGTFLGGLLLQFAGPTATILTVAFVCAIGLARGLSDRHLRAAQWPA